MRFDPQDFVSSARETSKAMMADRERILSTLIVDLGVPIKDLFIKTGSDQVVLYWNKVEIWRQTWWFEGNTFHWRSGRGAITDHK